MILQLLMVKKTSLCAKGSINNQISLFVMQKLSDAGIETHVEQQLSPCEIVVKKLK